MAAQPNPVYAAPSPIYLTLPMEYEVRSFPTNRDRWMFLRNRYEISEGRAMMTMMHYGLYLPELEPFLADHEVSLPAKPRLELVPKAEPAVDPRSAVLIKELAKLGGALLLNILATAYLESRPNRGKLNRFLAWNLRFGRKTAVTVGVATAFARAAAAGDGSNATA